MDDESIVAVLANPDRDPRLPDVVRWFFAFCLPIARAQFRMLPVGAYEAAFGVALEQLARETVRKGAPLPAHRLRERARDIVIAALERRRLMEQKNRPYERWIPPAAHGPSRTRCVGALMAASRRCTAVDDDVVIDRLFEHVLRRSRVFRGTDDDDRRSAVVEVIERLIRPLTAATLTSESLSRRVYGVAISALTKARGRSMVGDMHAIERLELVTAVSPTGYEVAEPFEQQIFRRILEACARSAEWIADRLRRDEGVRARALRLGITVEALRQRDSRFVRWLREVWGAVVEYRKYEPTYESFQRFKNRYDDVRRRCRANPEIAAAVWGAIVDVLLIPPLLGTRDQALNSGLAARSAHDLAGVKHAAERLVHLMRNGVLSRTVWLEPRAGDLVALAETLVGSAPVLARDLLVTAAPTLRHLRRDVAATVRRVLVGDAHATFAFVRNGHGNFDAFDMTSANILQTLRRASMNDGTSADDFLFALGRVHGPDRFVLIAMGLAGNQRDARLWRAAADALLVAGEIEAAAVAYEWELEPPSLDQGSDLIATLRRLAGDEIAVRPGREDGGPNPELPSLVNLAIIRRRQGGTAAAVVSVDRFVNRVPAAQAARAYFHAGAGEKGISLLIERLAQPMPRERATGIATELACLYWALGRAVEGVAAMRVMCDIDAPVGSLLASIFGGSHHRRRWQRRSGYELLPETDEAVEAAAIEALLAHVAPSDGDERAAIACAAHRDGDPAARRRAIATLEALGPACARAVHRTIVEGDGRMRTRLYWLLERWAWQVAEERFVEATGLRRPPRESAPVISNPIDEMHVQLRSDAVAAIDRLRHAQVEEGRGLVDDLCARLAGQGHWERQVVLNWTDGLVDLLLAEGDVARARTLVMRVAGPDPNHELIRRHRALFADDAERAFDFALADPDKAPAFEAMGLTHQDVVRIASGRLDAGALDLATTVRVVSAVYGDALADIVRRALRCFPDSPTLLEHHAHALLAAGRPAEALAVFERCVGSSGGWLGMSDVGLFAGYPPRLREGPIWRAGVGVPTLVNVAILSDRISGHGSALAAIERHRANTAPVVVAAAYRAIGEVDCARGILEDELRRKGRRVSGDSLRALIGLYAGLDRLVDAIALSHLVERNQGDFHAAKEHVDMLLSALIIVQDEDELTDECIAYEGRFVESRATELAMQRLLASRVPSSAERERAEGALREIEVDDFTTQVRALDELRELGPVAATPVAAALQTMSSRSKELGELLESWAWDTAAANLARDVRVPESVLSVSQI